MNGLLNNLASAIQFNTILPFGKNREFNPQGMIPFFPVVGIVLGFMLMGFDHFALKLWSMPVVSVLDVILLAAVTGAFHLDGLGDAADGLLGHHTKEKALIIMKDSRIGAMGLVAVVCILGLKWGGLSGITENRGLLLFIIPAYSRASSLFGIKYLEYGRPGGGTGHGLFENPLKTKDFSALMVPIILSIFIGWKFVVLNITFIVVTALMIRFYKKRIGCVTGDMLGAMIEVTESVLFLAVSSGVVL